jgi:hypothetical protein
MYGLTVEGLSGVADYFVGQAIELSHQGSSGATANRGSMFNPPGSVWTCSWWSDAAVVGVSLSYRVGGVFDTSATNAFTQIKAPTPTGETSNGYTKYYCSFSSPDIRGITDTYDCATLSFNIANAVNIAGMQLEPGPVCTPHEHRPIGTELALCQRYFQAITGTEYYHGQVLQAYNESRVWGKLCDLPTTMRVAPTVTNDDGPLKLANSTAATNSPMSSPVWKSGTNYIWLNDAQGVDSFFTSGFASTIVAASYMIVYADAEL